MVSDRPRVPPGISDVRRTSRGWEARVGLYTDEAGYFGRQCPDPECRTFFKLSVAEYESAPQSLQLTCPVCGLVADHQRFITPDQKQRSETAALEFARSAADQVIRDWSRRQASSPQRHGGVRIEWTAHRNPPRSPRPLPTYVELATIRTFECPNGGHHAVIYDLLAFCPWCGPDKTPPHAVFHDNLAAQRRLLALVGELPDEARASVEAVGGVTALTERALTGVVAATQNLAKRLHAHGGKSPPKDNPWQNVDRLQRQWLADFDYDPLDGLDAATVRSLRLAFSRRHLLEHNGGVIDERYKRVTGEGSIGRRVRITPAFVDQALAAVIALAGRLEATAR
jgi:hypothetical protein